VLVIIILAAVLRFYDLNLVPLHHDEGVNGNFLVRLVREGAYRYDPENYHGPTLYYLTAVIPWIVKILFGTKAAETYGLNTAVIRLVTGLFGLATVGLVFTLRRRLGTVATLSAGLLLAISPGAVYLSRYFIHETLFVFFTFGLVVAALRFYEERNQVYLLLASASAALLFATKETAMISAAVLAIAFASTHVYLRLTGVTRGKKQMRGGRPVPRPSAFQQFITDLGGPASVALWSGLAVLVFATLYVLFYSSFFKNYPQGLYDSLKTFEVWTKTGKEAHVHPPYTYLSWLGQQEAPVLFLGAVGAAFAVLKPRTSFPLFTALWAFGLIAAYSLVPYKTPWLVLNFVIPLALISGHAMQSIYDMDRKQLRLPAIVLLLAVAFGLYKSIDLNFFNYDNDDSKYVYVYAHTKRATLKLVDEIDRLAKQGEGDKTGITIVSPDYWPLPWYLRNYSRVGYYKGMTPTNEPLIIASETQKAEIQSTYGELYKLVPSGDPGGAFELRPGVSLLLYSRRTFKR
jgi:uncharacterized protein (TIGR03663 family)